MVFVAKVAKHLSSPNEKKGTSEDDSKGPRLSLPWLVRKMVREANHEAVSEVKATMKVRLKINLAIDRVTNQQKDGLYLYIK